MTQQDSRGRESTGSRVGRVIGHGLWMLIPLLSFGFLGWLPASQTWWRARTTGWLITALSLILTFIGFLIALPLDDTGDVWVPMFLLSAIGGTVAAAIGRPVFFGSRPAAESQPVVAWRPAPVSRPVAGPDAVTAEPAVQAVLYRRQRRQQAREIAANDPAMALELGIGRPDLARTYDDGGLVDLNNIPADSLVAALGWERSVAEAYAIGREMRRGYASLAEVEALSGIAPDVLGQDAERLIVLPYRIQ